MSSKQTAPVEGAAAVSPPRSASRPVLPKYSREKAFQDEVRRRVDAYFADTGKSPRDCWQLYLKTAVVLLAFFGSYLLLVFVAETWWQALPHPNIHGMPPPPNGDNYNHTAGPPP